MSNINIVQIIFLVLWIISFLAWLIWFIGYPIYKKVKREKVFDENGCLYALGLCMGALAMNLLNLFMKLIK